MFRWREKLEGLGPDSWRLLALLPYDGARDSWVVPAGFVTDYATVPWWVQSFIPRTGLHALAAILHDYLRRLAREHRAAGFTGPGAMTYSTADGVFRRVMRESGVSRPRYWLMWAAVRVDSRMRDADGKDWRQLAVVLACAWPLLLAALVLPLPLSLLLWRAVETVDAWIVPPLTSVVPDEPRHLTPTESETP